MTFLEEHLLTAIVFLPLVGAFAALAFPKGDNSGVRGFAIAVCLVDFALALWLWARFDPTLGAVMQLAETVPWVTSLGISYAVGVDGVAVLMVVLRMAQGVAVGGEYTSSIVFLAEKAPEGRRAFFSSWAMFGATGGIMLGSAVGAGLTNFLGDAALAEWGWRVAFLGGIAVALVGYLIRRGMTEEDQGEPEPSPIKTAFTQHWREMLRVSALNVVAAVSFYLMFVYIVTWLVDRVHEPSSTALDINTISMATLLVFIPVSAILSDKYGRRLMLLIGMGSLALLAYPLLMLMHHQDMMMILAGQIGFAAVLSMFMSTLPAAMTEMFPRNIRVTAVSVGYNFTYAIFGGTAPIVAVWLIDRSHDDLAFAWYIAAMAVVSFCVALTLKDRRNEPLS